MKKSILSLKMIFLLMTRFKIFYKSMKQTFNPLDHRMQQNSRFFTKIFQKDGRGTSTLQDMHLFYFSNVILLIKRI